MNIYLDGYRGGVIKTTTVFVTLGCR